MPPSRDISSPLVTVALPVFNEEKHIDETLKSLAAQDYPNLEILISDNCSSDQTGAICREYAERYKWIHYRCNERNLGLTVNYALLLEKAQGKYIMYAEGHNKWSRNLVKECVSLLENHSSATIAFGTPSWIDDEGQPLNKFSGWYDTRGLNPLARFFMVFWGSMMPQLGVLRRKDLPDLRTFNFTGADFVVLSMLALKGEFIHAANTCFYRRQVRPPENHNARMKRYKSNDVQIAKTLLSQRFPLWKLPLKLLKEVLRSQISAKEKLYLFLLLLPTLPFRYLLGKKYPESIK